MQEQAFVDAQAAALERHGISAQQRFVKTPVVDGKAQVLVTGTGPDVVLLNGLGTPAAMFAPLMARLPGFKLHAVDLPGFGLTNIKAGMTSDLKSTATNFVEQVHDGLGLDKPIIIANSLGALWASWFALAHPSRLSGLVYVGCPALILDTSAPLPMRLLSTPLGPLMMRIRPPSEAQVKELSKMVKEYPLPPEIAELILETERLADCNDIFLPMLRSLITLRGSRPEVALTSDQLAQIETPTLLVFAHNDPMGAEPVGRRAAEAMPNAELQMVDGGHAPWVHHSDQIAPIITEYLGRQIL